MMADEIRLYYRSQNDLTIALKSYIDSYFAGEVSDDALHHTIREIAKANPTLMPGPGQMRSEFPLRMKNQLAKKRIDIIRKSLEVVK